MPSSPTMRDVLAAAAAAGTLATGETLSRADATAAGGHGSAGGR